MAASGEQIGGHGIFQFVTPLLQQCHISCQCGGIAGHIETVVCLSRKKVNDRINFDINIEALPDRVSKTATYAEIKAYVLEHYGFKVSSLYIAQIKDKHGIKERENYNIGEGKSKELICPPEKEEAITNALKHFNMI